MTRNRGNLRVGNVGPGARGRNRGWFAAASVFDPAQFSNDAGEGDGVNSTRQEEEKSPEAGSRQRKETNSAKTRFRSPRVDEIL